MSLENAILEHAGAIRELAAALRERNVPLAAIAGEAQSAIKEIRDSMASAPMVTDTRAAEKIIHEELAKQQAGDAEMEQAVEKVEKNAAAEQARAGSAAAKTSAKAAPSDPKPAASGAAEPAGTNDGAEPLDYEKDVKPLLVTVAKERGKVALAELLKGVGLPEGQKGHQLNAAQLVEAKKQAEKLIAG